jgi:RNA polymerase sigma-70 factor, ECF subfamily
MTQSISPYRNYVFSIGSLLQFANHDGRCFMNSGRAKKTLILLERLPTVQEYLQVCRLVGSRGTGVSRGLCWRQPRRHDWATPRLDVPTAPSPRDSVVEGEGFSSMFSSSDDPSSAPSARPQLLSTSEFLNGQAEQPTDERTNHPLSATDSNRKLVELAKAGDERRNGRVKQDSKKRASGEGSASPPVFVVEAKRKVLEAFLSRHLAILVAYAMRLVRNSDSAADIVQDACLRAITTLQHFDGDSSIGTWLCGIIRNCYRERCRKQRRAMSVEDFVEGAAAPPVADLVAATELGEQIYVALEMLSPEICTTFVLFAVSGLSYKEIAAFQDIPIGTVMSRIHAARKKLKAYLRMQKVDLG